MLRDLTKVDGRDVVEIEPASREDLIEIRAEVRRRIYAIEAQIESDRANDSAWLSKALTSHQFLRVRLGELDDRLTELRHQEHLDALARIQDLLIPMVQQ